MVVTSSDKGVLTGPRWSSAVMCPRKAFYEAVDAPRREWLPHELQRMRRGQVWEEAVVADVVDGFRRQGRRPRRQETVAWPAADPIGTGHMDCYIPSERSAIEVVSNAGGQLPDYKCLQVAGYALNHPNADQAFVLSVDTHTGDDPVYPIDLSGLEPRVREIEDTVYEGVKTGVPPERTCRTPFDGPAQFCPFVEHCFADWTFPPLEELLADPKELEQLADAEDDVSDARQTLKDAEEKRNDIRSRLRPLVPANAESIAGGITVKRTVSPRTLFSLSDARKAGHDLPEPLQAFVKTSDQERWTVKRVEQL
jgi:hypothetical protein